MSDDLIAFLRARLDWDEQDLAQLRQWAEVGVDHTQGRMWVMGGASAVMHARRALAEVEAKRRMTDLHVEAGRLTGDGYPAGGYAWCGTCGSGEPNEYPAKWPCATLRLLALPYADHPDYRPEWRPVAE